MAHLRLAGLIVGCVALLTAAQHQGGANGAGGNGKGMGGINSPNPSTSTTAPATNECSKTECGPAPGMPNKLCPDGSMLGPGVCLGNALSLSLSLSLSLLLSFNSSSHLCDSPRLLHTSPFNLRGTQARADGMPPVRVAILCKLARLKLTPCHQPPP